MSSHSLPTSGDLDGHRTSYGVSHSVSHTQFTQVEGDAEGRTTSRTTNEMARRTSLREPSGSRRRPSSRTRELTAPDGYHHSSAGEEEMPVRSTRMRASFAEGTRASISEDGGLSVRGLRSEPAGQHAACGHAKTQKLHQFTNSLHGKFSDFVAGVSAIAEQDHQALKDEMQRCFEMVRELLKQESAERVQQADKLHQRCAQLEVDLQGVRNRDMSSIKERVDSLDNSLMAFADRHTEEVKDILKAQKGFAEELATFGEAHEQHLEVEESLDTAMKGLTAAVERTTSALTATRARLDEMKDGAHACDQRCATVESELAGLGQRMADLQRNFDSALHSHAVQLDAVRGDHSALSDHVTGKHGELGDLIALRHKDLGSLIEKRGTELGNLIAAETMAREKHLSEEAEARKRGFSALQEHLENADRRHSSLMSGSRDDQLRELKFLKDGQAKHTEEIGAMRTELGSTHTNLECTLSELQAMRNEVDQVLSLLAVVQKAWRPNQRPKGRRSTMGLEATSPKTPKAEYEPSAGSQVHSKPGHHCDPHADVGQGQS